MLWTRHTRRASCIGTSSPRTSSSPTEVRQLRYQSAAEMRTDLQRLKRDTSSGRLHVPSTGEGQREGEEKQAKRELPPGPSPLTRSHLRRKNYYYVAAAFLLLAVVAATF